MAEKITEEVVEGIWAESQYKVENIPGYADLFKRAGDALSVLVDNDNKDPKAFEDVLKIMFEMYLLELRHRHGPLEGK